MTRKKYMKKQDLLKIFFRELAGRGGVRCIVIREEGMDWLRSELGW